MYVAQSPIFLHDIPKRHGLMAPLFTREGGEETLMYGTIFPSSEPFHFQTRGQHATGCSLMQCATCFYVACELRMIFIFLDGWKTSELLRVMKMTWNSVYRNEGSLAPRHALCSVDRCCALQQQSWSQGAVPTVGDSHIAPGLQNLKYLLSGPLQKVSQPLTRLKLVFIALWNVSILSGPIHPVLSWNLSP